jgi:2-methylcitrate dehydratase PrpD
MEFCMAILLLERKGGLNEFTDEVVNRPDVQAMIQKVEFGVHPEAEGAGYDKMTTILEIALIDGRVIRDRADFGKGSPAIPMTYDEVADKFRECAAYSRWPKKNGDQVVELVRHLEDVKHVRELTGLLSRERAGTAQRRTAAARTTRTAKSGRSQRGAARKAGATKAKKRGR